MSIEKPYFEAFRAASWSCANGELTDRQPHMFYRAGDVDSGIDQLIAQHEFEKRKWKALEAFYLRELRRPDKESARIKAVYPAVEIED